MKSLSFAILHIDMAVKVTACFLFTCQMTAILLFQLYTTHTDLQASSLAPSHHRSALSSGHQVSAHIWQADYALWDGRKEHAAVNMSGRRRVQSVDGQVLLGDYRGEGSSHASHAVSGQDTQLGPPPAYHTPTSNVLAILSLPHFTFTINEPDLCTPDEESSLPPYLLLQVHSHVSHKPLRDSIRNTWGRISRDYDTRRQVRLIFLLGEDDSTKADFTEKIKHESRLYRDIVTADFKDTYRNLTIKSVAGLVWATKYCSNSRYLFKTDDDVYFNVSSLIHLLDKMDIGVNILGALNNNATVMRSGLWAVGHHIYPDTEYPPYCAGNSYVMSLRTAGDLLEAVPNTRMLPIEDVYVTGLLAKVTGRTCQGHPSFPHWYVGPSPKHLCALLSNRLYGVHNVQYEQMYKIFQKVQYEYVCDSRTKYKSLYQNKK